MTTERRPALSRVADLFSSITLGIVLLALLFLYCSVGSAGVLYPTSWAVFSGESWVHAQIRQWRPFEMTEFEWFHWWPFDLLVGLICVNVVTATLRRIPLNVVNLGVWLIHTGILILALGSWIYFDNKVEGDVPVVRRDLAVVTPAGARARLPVVPGNAITLGDLRLRIWSVDPEWRPADAPADAPARFRVQAFVELPDGTRFVRTLVDGAPELTEDLVESDDARRPMAPAREVLGRPVAHADVQLDLEYAESRYLYLAHWVQKSWALYVREITGGVPTPWVERPVDGLPLYNDSVRAAAEIWTAPGDRPPVHPLAVTVPAAHDGDPLPGTALHITDYLRYARMQTARAPGGPLDPYAEIVLDDGTGNAFPYTLEAFDRERAYAEENFVGFFWVRSEDEWQHISEPRAPTLTLTAPDADAVLTHAVEAVALNDPELAWSTIPGSDIEFRVEFVEDFDDHELRASMASVELRDGAGERWRRWVFDAANVAKNVDLLPSRVGTDGERLLVPTPGDELPDRADDLEITYNPGRAPAAISIVAGPEPEQLGVVLALDRRAPPEYLPLAVGERVALGGGATLRVTEWSAHSRLETRPYRVPLAERDAQARHRLAMVGVDVPGSVEGHVWVPYHHYPLQTQRDNLRRYNYDPAEFSTRDGRAFQVVLSRRRLPLPAPVVLEDFVLTEHVGGFTGSALSVRDWTSLVRFREPDGALTDTLAVSVNAPAEHAGLSYFQMEWDPPSGPRFQGDVASQGLNYTVLGVGNRHGVLIQLLGCAIAVAGMLYAFYVKPILRRRLVARARAGVATGAAS